MKARRFVSFRFLIILLTIASTLLSSSTYAQMKKGDIDVYAGIDFNYRDIFLRGHFSDLLINITPGVKWNLGHHVEIGASALIPVINMYGDYYKYVRINTASASWQFAAGPKWKMKVSGGIFTQERYGLDFKTQFALNQWLAFSGEVGLTGKLTMRSTWAISPMSRLTFQLGPDFWIKNYATQVSLRGGRYIYGDYGCMVDGMRNFKHVSLGVFAQYSSADRLAGGFKLIVMIPPYKRSCRKFHIRPASNFRLTYCSEALSQAIVEYNTEAEQNERTGWWDRDLNPWGQATMPPDFYPCSQTGIDTSDLNIITVDENMTIKSDSISTNEIITEKNLQK